MRPSESEVADYQRKMGKAARFTALLWPHRACNRPGGQRLQARRRPLHSPSGRSSRYHRALYCERQGLRAQFPEGHLLAQRRFRALTGLPFGQAEARRSPQAP